MTDDIKNRLADAIATNEVINIIYYGGSKSGAERMILPKRLDADSVFAQCLSSGRVKSFKLKNIELVGNNDALDEMALLHKIRWLSIAPNKTDTKAKTFMVKRSLKLIVPQVTYQDNVGELHNSHWAYRVGYGFREALDLSFDTRYEQKKPYLTWTQGCLISFCLGDILRSDKGFPCLQVRDASPVTLDEVTGQWGEGFVTYTLFGQAGTEAITVTQMEFLQLLINGMALATNTAASHSEKTLNFA